MATALKTPAQDQLSEPPKGRYLEVPVSIVMVDKGFNNRRELGDVKELAESIRSVGLLQPLLVWLEPIAGTTTEPRGYVHVIAGHRRLAAVKSIGSTHVPVIIVDQDERGRMEALLVENLHRRDIDALEEADGYQRLIALGLSQSQVAAKVGRSQAHISKRVALLGLVPEATELLNSGGIALDKAIELAKVDPELQAAVIRKASEGYGRYRSGEDIFEYTSPSRIAQEITEERAREQRKKDARAKAKKDGVQLLKGEIHDYSWYNRTDRPLGKGPDAIDVPLREHRALPCHRAWVTGNGELKYACADPASHMTKAEAKKWKERHTGRGEQERERKERLGQLQEIKIAREQLLTAALPKLDRSTTLNFALESFIRIKAGHGYEKTSPASLLRLLGEDGGERNQQARLLEYCRKSDANLLRAAAALGYLLGVEALDRDQHYDAHGTQYAATMDWLKTVGYQPTEVETEFLERIKQDSDKDIEELAQCRICGCTDEKACEGGCSWVEDPGGPDSAEEGELCSRCLGVAALQLREDKEGPLAEDITDDEAAEYLGLTLENVRAVLSAPVTKAVEVYQHLLEEQRAEGLDGVDEVIVKPDDEHSGGWTATIPGQGAESTQTAEAPLDQPSDGGSVAPALPAGEPVSQHVCRSCGTREGPWAEMVEIGWLCVNCDAAVPAAIVEKPGPVDQRARTRA